MAAAKNMIRIRLKAYDHQGSSKEHDPHPPQGL